MKIAVLVMVLAMAVVAFTAVSSNDAFADAFAKCGKHHGGYATCGKYVAPAYSGCGGYYGGYWPGLYMGPYGKCRHGYGKRGGGFLPGLGGFSLGSFGIGSY